MPSHFGCLQSLTRVCESWMGRDGVLLCLFKMNELTLVFMDGGAKGQIVSYSAEVITLGRRNRTQAFSFVFIFRALPIVSCIFINLLR